jgi:hypothetical protein
MIKGKTFLSAGFLQVNPWIGTPRALAPRRLKDSEEKT